MKKRKKKQGYHTIEEYILEKYALDYNTKFSIPTIYKDLNIDINMIKIVYEFLKEQNYIDIKGNKFVLNYKGYKYLYESYKNSTNFSNSIAGSVFSVLAIFISYLSFIFTSDNVLSIVIVMVVYVIVFYIVNKILD